MNSRAVTLLVVVVVAAILCQKSDAFTAGAGNLKKRDFSEFQAARRLVHVCEAARKSCSMLNVRRAMGDMRIDEHEDEEQQQQQE
ncbi:hypothetical protein ACROYT_G011158 [Oculina patagonica]